MSASLNCRRTAFASLFLVFAVLATLATAAPGINKRAGPALEAPSGWKLSWNKDSRVSNGASTSFIALFPVDSTATTVTQTHLDACVERCATTSECGFVNLVKQTGSSQGNVVCMLFPHYIASTKATYKTGVQKSGGSVDYSYGIRSLCTPINGGSLACAPATLTTSASTSATASTSASSSVILPTSGKVVQVATSLVAPNGWKLSWNKAGRLSNGASTRFISLFTVDKTATAVTQAHINSCLSRCSTTSKCGFVNLIQMTGSSQGNIVCMMFPKYFASTLATYTTGPQRSGGRVVSSYGIRSLCTPINGGGLTCSPSAVSASTTISVAPTTMSTVRTTSTTSTTSTSTSSSSTSAATVSGTGLPLPKYSLVQPNRGASFFSNNYWDFWNTSDPTHGTVQYVDQPTAVSMGLIGITNNQAFVRASDQGLMPGQYRPSVRFQSKPAFDAALVVIDVAKMPVGCATWPAIWTVAGATWPENGEIDIMEGIGYTSQGTNANLMSVHMNESSTLTSSSSSYTGNLASNQCMTNYGLGNTGCSFRDNNANGPSWGPNFNSNGGGIWAALWGDGLGVRIWFWGRASGNIPAALQDPTASPSTLDPSTWGTPMANFQSPLIDQKLNQQNIVLDLTINGDWAGNVAMDNTAQCGTNHSAALSVGSNYYNAQFVLNGIDVYTSQ